MPPLDTLADDQRAVLELVLRQGRSYGELSELLGIPERDVRARADAGLRALAGEADSSLDTGRIADWLLGQQPEAEAERTRAAVARNAAAREWAATAAERLRELGGAAVPEVPAGDDAPRARPRPLRDDAAPPPARPRPLREEPAATPAAALRSSKLGGALLIAVLVIVVGGLIAFVVTRGSDDNGGAPAAASKASPTATATPAASANDIVLRGTGGAAGLMRLVRGSDGKVRFAIAAEKVPANKGREVYAVWFTRSGGKPRRLGFAQTQVGKDGVLTTGGPQKADEAAFPSWFATYDKILITRETDAKATKPGPAVLVGTLPGAAG
jgi:Sigma-70, region 4